LSKNAITRYFFLSQLNTEVCFEVSTTKEISVKEHFEEIGVECDTGLSVRGFEPDEDIVQSV
jgi:hypothetical protein